MHLYDPQIRLPVVYVIVNNQLGRVARLRRRRPSRNSGSAAAPTGSLASGWTATTCSRPRLRPHRPCSGPGASTSRRCWIGRAAVLKPGRDITVIGYSRAAVIALDVARRLESGGISAEVIDLRSLRPLDRQAVRKTSRAVIVEDDWLSHGIGAEIAATIQEGAFDYLDAPVRRVAAAKVPLPYAKPLELAALPNAGALTRVIHETLDATCFGR